MNNVPNTESRAGRKYAAPALARGVALLELLADGVGRSLEQVSQETSLAKSSLLRLLETMEELGLVERDAASKRYRALQQFVVLDDGRQFERRVTAALRHLAAETGHTAEYYVPGEDGLVLLQRAEPANTEVCVSARIGFLRAWKGELDAVLAVALASGNAVASGRSRFWVYVKDGVQGELSAAEFASRLAAARRDGALADTVLNSNGVRRVAAAVCEGETLVGVLALAQVRAPRAPDRTETLLTLIKKEAVALGRAAASS